MLRINSIVTGYQGQKVLREISLTVPTGQIMAVIGHNGAGKSTLLKTIFGIQSLWSGRIQSDEQDISKFTVGERLLLGFAFAPQGNRVFNHLTVAENLIVAARPSRNLRQTGDPIASACNRFPQLEPLLSKRSGLLSGGEKKLLALSMALLRSPKLLLLDEPSLGLSPSAASDVFAYIVSLKASGFTIVIAEQKVKQVLAISDCVCALKTGSIDFFGSPREIESPDVMRRVFL